jgi:hypothetical protein
MDKILVRQDQKAQNRHIKGEAPEGSEGDYPQHELYGEKPHHRRAEGYLRCGGRSAGWSCKGVVTGKAARAVSLSSFTEKAAISCRLEGSWSENMTKLQIMEIFLCFS